MPMNSTRGTIPSFVTLYSNPVSTFFTSNSCPKLLKAYIVSKIPNGILLKKRDVVVRTSRHQNSNYNNHESVKRLNWLPTGGFAADKAFRLISTTIACPIYQFIASPSTFLRSVYPRIKLVWLLALAVLPARSHIIMHPSRTHLDGNTTWYTNWGLNLEG